MKLENNEIIIKKKVDFDNSSKTTGFVINGKLNSGVKIVLTNKRFYIEPALNWLNKIIPLLPRTILDINLKDINNYSVDYVRNINKIPRITVRFNNNQQFSFCTSENDLKDWQGKFSELSIAKT